MPAEDATERLRQELAAVTFKEYALQDGNTLEATQTMIESRAVTEFPLGDQEILLRHLHQTARRYVADHKETADDRRCPRSSPTSSRSPTGAWPPRPSATPSAWPARWTSCRPSTTPPSLGWTAAIGYLDGFELAALPPEAEPTCCWLCYSLVNVSFPVEVWRQPRVPDSGAAHLDVVVEPAV